MQNKSKDNKVVIGILAHVDAGKTTLSEAMLYAGGSIRSMGRVDNQNAFLDNYILERERGITIFSKQAVIETDDIKITLLDTPGHVDFAAETERTLQVLDYAILVINGADGVQGHTMTLWQLLGKYQIPVFLFVNKMDQAGTDDKEALGELKDRLSENCIDFTKTGTANFKEEIALCDDQLLETFLTTDEVTDLDIQELIAKRTVFPCYFGSALKQLGIETFMQGLVRYISAPQYPDEFGAKVFKISRDTSGNRLTHMKITGGTLKVKTVLGESDKVNQIRFYSGEKYEIAESASAGDICVVTGLSKTWPGTVLGAEKTSSEPVLNPVLTYQVILPSSCDAAWMLPKLRQLEEELPELQIVWNETLKEIQVKIMGEVQIEILKHLIKERFDTDVEFGTGNIVYKETIMDTVEGVGHFEPLRHYAEVHLIIQSGPQDSGVVIDSSCSEDFLDRNYQRLIISHLKEREHKGVLTGAGLTDVKITLAAGRAHPKHTEGGDFRQAAYRAVRQGLKEASSILLEPYYQFRLEVPEKMVGRAITDLERMRGTFEGPVVAGEAAVLTGTAPVAAMRSYQQEVTAYTKGHGRLFCTVMGYAPCQNAAEVIAAAGYDSERDADNPTGSVFCSHGAGFHVPWDKVKDYMHIESQLERPADEREAEPGGKTKSTEEAVIGTEEIDAILDKTYFANRRAQPRKWIKKSVATQTSVIKRVYQKPESKDEYLLIDGYNIIYAWDELKELAEINIDGARGKLLDIISNYQGIRKINIIVVFDAYRVMGRVENELKHHNIHVVFTREAETADQYIEKFAHQNSKKYHVTVATSDGMEQIIIRGAGCSLLSARELKAEVEAAGQRIQEEYAAREILTGEKKPNIIKEQLEKLE